MEALASLFRASLFDLGENKEDFNVI